MAKKKNKNTQSGMDKEMLERICNEHQVDTLYYNPDGEVFTEYTYALSSVEKDKSKVSVYKRESSIAQEEDSSGIDDTLTDDISNNENDGENGEQG